MQVKAWKAAEDGGTMTWGRMTTPLGNVVVGGRPAKGAGALVGEVDEDTNLTMGNAMGNGGGRISH
ncbi:hypothetical protein L484_008899 [Morus notabilis]|uniref:Uncharacterized protein n=1 Tax=Morus notabilis TaxID=981085 RepID=W9R4G7_9ROSA|nr:hypothetical protein L484_008899 [Morus notabilis]